MSTEVNTLLFERAAEQIDRWEGTIMAKMIEYDLETEDLDQLSVHVSEAEALEAQEGVHAYDIY